MRHRITGIEPGSIAEEVGIEAGDELVLVNGESVVDWIDYQALSAQETVTLLVARDGEETEYEIERDVDEAIGLRFESGLMDAPRVCANRCVFCFVDQLPGGMRESLYVKDDDWRLSLLMGNYVTLTNVGDKELARLIERHASPLYLSVHAVDPVLRTRLLQNPRAGRIMDQLRALAEGGIQFHAQVVLCPQWNDGEALEQTIAALYGLWPTAQSLAVVPVGLTGHRGGLPAVSPVTREAARAVIACIEAWQARCLRETEHRFVFAADELYLRAGLPLPVHEAYEDYPQLENGVGLLSLFERQWEEALARWPRGETVKPATIACGVSVAPVMRDWLSRAPEGQNATVVPVVNRFFGDSVTVTGLITGEDLIEQCRGKVRSRLLITRSMLRAGESCFLDGVTVADVSRALAAPVEPVETDAESLAAALRE